MSCQRGLGSESLLIPWKSVVANTLEVSSVASLQAGGASDDYRLGRAAPVYDYRGRGAPSHHDRLGRIHPTLSPPAYVRRVTGIIRVMLLRHRYR